MTTLVVLSVVDIVLLIAGLAFYLFIVGGQLAASPPTSRSAPNWCAPCRHNAEVIEAGVERINHTGRVIAGALPLLYGMAEGIVVGATYEPAPEGTVRGRRPSPHPVVAVHGCTTASATGPPTLDSRPNRSPKSPPDSATSAVRGRDRW